MHNSTKQMDAKHFRHSMDIVSTKDSEKMFSFFDKRKLTSEFDHKGAKQFLNDKQKALAEIILNDEINIVMEKKCKKSKNAGKNNAQCHHFHHEKNKNKLMPVQVEYCPTFGENDDNKNIFICIEH